MIAILKGIIIEIGKGHIILENNGVGYLINVVPVFISKISLNQKLCIYIKQLFKEEDVLLYGFENYDQKIWFEYLIKVDGVGAKSAISILNIFSIKEIESAILNKDEKFFTSISGIGSKIAIRIINEMQKIPAKINLDKSYISSTVENTKNKTFQTDSVNLFDEEFKSDKKSSKNRHKKDLQSTVKDVDDNDYQKIIQESIQAITKLGFNNVNLYKDIRLILNEIEESHKSKLKVGEAKNFTITSEEIVSKYLKKISTLDKK